MNAARAPALLSRLRSDPAARSRVLRVLAGGLLLWALVAALAARYTLAFDRQDARCLPWRAYLVDRADRTPRFAELQAFAARGIPHYRDGTLLAKFVAGLPGDRIEITSREVRVRGIAWGAVDAGYARAAGRTQDTLTRDERIPAGKVAMLAASGTSYDSRYWGLVDHTQLRGRAIPLW